jgi:hypothetical protein
MGTEKLFGGRWKNSVVFHPGRPYVRWDDPRIARGNPKAKTAILKRGSPFFPFGDSFRTGRLQAAASAVSRLMALR